MPRISLIFARAANGVIGKDGVMPWHLPEDLAHFKNLTRGHPVIMGRKTWDSLPARFRPLPDRTNIVITRQTNWHADGAQRATGLIDAIDQCSLANEIWVIGGSQIYAQAVPLATQIEVTEIAQNFDGDAFAPLLGCEWQETARNKHISTNGMTFSFVTYNKIEQK